MGTFRNTTNLPDELVREVIAFVKPKLTCGLDVKVANCGRGRFKGAAYTEGCARHHSARPFVNLYVTASEKLFPFRGEREPQRGGYLPTPWLASRVEALVYVAAHELRHIWQAQSSRGRVWGSRGKYPERDADAYAIRMLRAWRKRPLVRSV